MTGLGSGLAYKKMQKLGDDRYNPMKQPTPLSVSPSVRERKVPKFQTPAASQILTSGLSQLGSLPLQQQSTFDGSVNARIQTGEANLPEVGSHP
mmetsp:Transcript_17082/g.26430  ORF Transcript_17082/g.26430 Transcript_17082/m.26430 type:complete len:94 (+) Transcript_17082:3426-3707(+)